MSNIDTRDVPWWREAVIYQVYPRSFYDTNGDGVGDLPGITAKLDYIAALGVDIVWISPFFTSPMKDFGYDVADYCDVDPLFGTLQDFDRLIARAHELGLKVMIDQVLSHTADAHPWFVESRKSRKSHDNAKSDWYVWADPKPDGTPPNNWLSVFGGSAWQWDARRRQYYMHNFLVSQPQMNFHHPEVQQAHLENIRFWLKRGVDGFRMDACNFHFHDRGLRDNPPALLRDSVTVSDSNPYGMQAHVHDKTQPENLDFLVRLRRLLDEYGAIAIGEVGADDSLAVMADYTAGGDKLHLAYSFNLLTADGSARYIRTQVEQFEARVKGGWASWPVGNHDSARVATRWNKGIWDPAFSKVVLAMQLSLKGTPCLYQGDELALTEAEIAFEDLQDPYGITFWPEFKGRDGCRTPMPWDGELANAGFSAGRPWLPVPAEHVRLAAAGQENDAGSPLRFARRFIAWRKGVAQLQGGEIGFFDAPEPVLAFKRELSGHGSVLAAFNLGAQPVQFALPQAAGAIDMSGHGMAGSNQQGMISLPPHGAWFGTV